MNINKFHSAPANLDAQIDLNTTPAAKRKRTKSNLSDLRAAKKQKTQANEEKMSHGDVQAKWNTILEKFQKEASQELSLEESVKLHEKFCAKFFALKKAANLNLKNGTPKELLEKMQFLMEIINPCPIKKEVFQEEKALLEKAVEICGKLGKRRNVAKAPLNKIKADIQKEHIPNLFYNFASLKSEKTSIKIDALIKENDENLASHTENLGSIKIKSNWEKVTKLLFGELERFKEAQEASKELQKSVIYANSTHAIGLCYKRLAESKLDAKRQHAVENEKNMRNQFADYYLGAYRFLKDDEREKLNILKAQFLSSPSINSTQNNNILAAEIFTAAVYQEEKEEKEEVQSAIVINEIIEIADNSIEESDWLQTYYSVTNQQALRALQQHGAPVSQLEDLDTLQSNGICDIEDLRSLEAADEPNAADLQLGDSDALQNNDNGIDGHALQAADEPNAIAFQPEAPAPLENDAIYIDNQNALQAADEPSTIAFQLEAPTPLESDDIYIDEQKTLEAAQKLKAKTA